MIYDYRRYYNVELNGIGSLSTLFNPLLKSSICFLAFASCFICNFPPFLFSFRCAVRRYCNADIKYYFFKEFLEYSIQTIQPKNRTECYRDTVLLYLADVY